MKGGGGEGRGRNEGRGVGRGGREGGRGGREIKDVMEGRGSSHLSEVSFRYLHNLVCHLREKGMKLGCHTHI